MDERNNRLLEFSASSRYNRDLFLLRFRSDYETFVDLTKHFEDTWKVIGVERDAEKRSQAGLIPLQGVCLRSMVYAFDALQGMQIAQVWPSVRIAVETLLIMGKFAHDPAQAQIWATWNGTKQERKLFRKTFQNELGLANALPRAESFRRVLSDINDEFLHPNPKFIFSPLTTGFKDVDGLPDSGRIMTHWLGQDLDVMEAHLLALVRLFADMVDASAELLQRLYDREIGSELRQNVERINAARAKLLVAKDVQFRVVLQNFGAWFPGRL